LLTSTSTAENARPVTWGFPWSQGASNSSPDWLGGFAPLDDLLVSLEEALGMDE